MNHESDVPAVKDGAMQRPVPTAWRQAFRGIVAAFAAGDFGVERGVEAVQPVPVEVARQIRNYVQDYGATLVALNEQTWSTSVCIWMGDHWEALVDLWTQEEGRSDLVLHSRVVDTGSGFRISIQLVCVP